MDKKYDSQSTIDTILSVSAQLFLEKGFDKTSVNDIALNANVSKGAIYHHFKSKDEIIKAVTELQTEIVEKSIEKWIEETSSLNGKEKLQSILEKNIESQEAHYLDNIMNVRMKSAEFVLSFMKDNVDNGSKLISQIIKEGIIDGSIKTEFPDECSEAFLLLLNVWCDPAVFNGDLNKINLRLKFLQNMMKSIGVDVLSDSLVDKTTKLLEKLYPGESEN